MIYYKFVIRDYLNSTAWISESEDLIYRRLLDVYYDTEQPIPEDFSLIFKKIRMKKSKKNLTDLKFILSTYFEETPSGWVQKRCEDEIATFHGNREQCRANGRKGGRPKKKPSGFPEETETEPNGFFSESETKAKKKATKNLELRTKNQELRKESNTPLPPCEGEPARDCNFESEEPKDQTPSQEAKPKKEPFDARAMCIIWNLAIEDGANFVGVREDSVKPGTKRHRAVTARIREQPDPDYWIATIERLMASDFANGRSKTAWRADFDFFVRPDTHIKINEGKYDNV